VAAVIAVDDFAHDGLAARSAADTRPTPRASWTDGGTPRVEEARTFGAVPLSGQP